MLDNMDIGQRSSSDMQELPRRVFARRSVWIALSVLVVLLAGGLYLARTHVQQLLQMVFIPTELRGASFVAVSSPHADIYAVQGLGFVKKSTLHNARTVDSFKEHVISLDAQGTHVALDDVHIPLGTTTKADISVAPSGKVFAYSVYGSQTSSVSSESRVPVRDPKQWSVWIVNMEQGSTFTLGEGMSPVFIDESHLLWQTSRGIFLADLHTREISLLLPLPTRYIHSRIVVSPDRSHIGIARTESNTTYISLYALKNNQLTFVRETESVPAVLSYALSNTALYAVALGTSHVEIWSQPWVQSKAWRHVLTVPSGYQVSQLMFQAT